MSVTAQIEGSGEGIVYTHTGILDGSQLPKQTQDHYNTFDTSKLRYQIMDFRGIERIEMSSDELRQTAKLFLKTTENLPPHHKLAIVTSNEPMFAFMKLWEIYIEDSNVDGKLFYSMETARSWINETTTQNRTA